MKTFIFIFSLFLSNVAVAQKFGNIAMTPPMGWNSWNRFGCEVNEKIIREAAESLIASGMKDAGYEYIVIDDCWQVSRDSLGFIVTDPQRFPSGIKALADYIHSKGLKFGIYSCAGRETCQNKPGSHGHEYQDAITYAHWGIDFLKLDWCNSEGQNPKESYTLMRDALYAAGRPVVYSICEWGLSKPWEWAAEVGHLWRTTGDIRENWDIPDAKEGKVWGGGVIINLDMQEGLEKFAGPGHWNDPDMLEVGNGNLTGDENKSHFSLWCMLAAPLMAGNDLSRMSAETKNILTNRDVIAIGQDPGGMQGFKIRDFGEFEIFYKPLQHEEVALCLFNRFDHELHIEMNWKDLECKLRSGENILKLQSQISRTDIQIPQRYKVTDLWGKKEIGPNTGILNADIPSHGVLLFKLSNK